MNPLLTLAMSTLMTVSATSLAATAATPPDVAKKPHAVKAPFGATREDDYYWLGKPRVGPPSPRSIPAGAPTTARTRTCWPT